VPVSKFPRLTVIMERGLKDRLEAFSSIAGKAAYQIIRDALESHFRPYRPRTGNSLKPRLGECKNTVKAGNSRFREPHGTGCH